MLASVCEKRRGGFLVKPDRTLVLTHYTSGRIGRLGSSSRTSVVSLSSMKIGPLIGRRGARAQHSALLQETRCGRRGGTLGPSHCGCAPRARPSGRLQGPYMSFAIRASAIRFMSFGSPDGCRTIIIDCHLPMGDSLRCVSYLALPLASVVKE